jgi:hypothetical protein
MNFPQKKSVSVPLMTSILLGLVIAQMPAQFLLADELKNVTDFTDCRAIKGKSERLRCYDTIADGGIFNEEALQQVRVENFGSKEKETKEEKEAAIDTLTFTVVRIQKDGNGIHYFQTSEGQVWKQVNRGGWSSEVPFEAVIATGALGSFFLANEGGKSTRVKRVR